MLSSILSKLSEPQESEALYNPTPPNVPLFGAIISIVDGIWGLLKGSWGVLDRRAYGYVLYRVTCRNRQLTEYIPVSWENACANQDFSMID